MLNAVVWLLESATEWGYQLVWRNLAQTVEHEARMGAYAHVQGLELAHFEDQSTGGLMAILNDDVNQLERFLDVGANNRSSRAAGASLGQRPGRCASRTSASRTRPDRVQTGVAAPIG